MLKASPHPFVDLQDLEILFNRLDAQAAQACLCSLPLTSSSYPQRLSYQQIDYPLIAEQMIGTPPMLLRERSRDIEKGFCPEIPAVFTSLEQARNSLDYYWNSCIKFLINLENNHCSPKRSTTRVQAPVDGLRNTEMVRQEYFDVCERWLLAFRAFLRKSGNSLDSRGLQAARTLEISHGFAMIYLNAGTVNVFNDETVWDRFTTHYERVVDLAALITESSTCEKVTERRPPDFNLDMSIVAPLYAVASRCRHPVIRRKAVSLLYAAPRQEGIWDSILTARVAERLINIEEAGLGNVTCCEDVPDWARISDVEVKFDLQGRLGTVRFCRQRSPLEKARDTVMETIRW